MLNMNKLILIIATLVMLFTSLGQIMASENIAIIPLMSTDIKALGSKEFVITNKGTKQMTLYNKDFSAVLKSWNFDQIPTSVAVSATHFYVTSFLNKGKLHKINIKTGAVQGELTLGSGSISSVLSKDEKTLYVANQFANTISKIDLESFKCVAEVAVKREPKCLVLSEDENLMFVANFLPYQRSDVDYVAAELSVVDLKSFKVIKHIKLANGSNALKGITLSPDKKFVLIAHNLGRFFVPTSRVIDGWINTCAISVVDIASLEYKGAVVLDEKGRGAAGAEKIAVNDRQIIVTHAGSHELSVIEYKPFIDRLLSYKDLRRLDFDLTLLEGIRKRVPVVGNGPRSMVVDGAFAYVTTYFSDTLNVIDLDAAKVFKTKALQPKRQETEIFMGEKIFNDARYCLEQWQSCNGCHPGDARNDGMNWDLMNDGVGNPKSCKSLISSYETPPSMITGIRVSADVATRKGFEGTQFFRISEYDASLVDTYLYYLQPVPSPYLVDGKLSANAQKGKKVFEDLGCGLCHSGEYYTDGLMHKIGDPNDFEQEDGWDTPTLIEVWRTAPYLFDGRAATMKDVFEEFKHGIGTEVSKKDIDNLVEYVNSL